ncbi:MAG: porin family protein [Deltaproteobacteria bacterium]|nr:porin family protein [Deltaproteobacteria bacterium]
MDVKVLLLIVTAFLTIANPAMAGNREGAVTLSPFFGGQMFAMGKEHHLDADFTMGFRGGYNFTRHVGAELMFGYTDTVHDPEVIRANIYRYGADILYHFMPDKNLIPFVAAGFGGMTVDYNYGLPDQTSAYFNYGVGVEYSLANRIALRGDFRHALILDNGDSAFEGTVGLKFQFGGR